MATTTTPQLQADLEACAEAGYLFDDLRERAHGPISAEEFLADYARLCCEAGKREHLDDLRSLWPYESEAAYSASIGDAVRAHDVSAATKTYGIVIEDGDAGRVQECPSLDEAHLAAQRVIEGDDGAPAADVVELDGAGPVRDCDGKVIADCHAPRRTIATYERDEPESRYVD